jgi:chemotaxis protein methyltransferase CheR
MPITQDDFKYICDLARREAAIVLESGKEYLVESRLSELAKTTGFAGMTELVAQLRLQHGTGPLMDKVVDSLTTNETLFFRDHHPFDALRKTIMPELIARRADVKRLNIWSAACSTGQEPYSIAMLLLEQFPALKTWDIKILATDISPTVLKRAGEGAYSQIEINRGLPASYLIKYFTKRDQHWLVSARVKERVTFRSMNLIQPWPIMPSLDLVFLRNVMIYFDIPTRKTILERVRTCLAPHGYLILGTAETTVNIDTGFRPVSVGPAVVYSAGAATTPAIAA